MGAAPSAQAGGEGGGCWQRCSKRSGSGICIPFAFLGTASAALYNDFALWSQDLPDFWVVDSGCTTHMSPAMQDFTAIHRDDGKTTVNGVNPNHPI
jgi:hypothetical protein